MGEASMPTGVVVDHGTQEEDGLVTWETQASPRDDNGLRGASS